MESVLQDSIERHVSSLKAIAIKPPFHAINVVAPALAISPNVNVLAKWVTDELKSVLTPDMLTRTHDCTILCDDLQLAHVFVTKIDQTISEVIVHDDVLGNVIYVNESNAVGRINFSIIHALSHSVLDLVPGVESISATNEEFISDQSFHQTHLSNARVTFEYDRVKEDGNFTISKLVLLADALGASVEATCRKLEDLGFTKRGRWRSLRDRGIDIASIRASAGIPTPIIDRRQPSWIPHTIQPLSELKS